MSRVASGHHTDAVVIKVITFLVLTEVVDALYPLDTQWARLIWKDLLTNHWP